MFKEPNESKGEKVEKILFTKLLRPADKVPILFKHGQAGYKIVPFKVYLIEVFSFDRLPSTKKLPT